MTWLMSACVLASWVIAAKAQPLADAAFAPVQADLFGTPGAFSNAWSDFDGDGDPDLAVSFRSGEVRLYVNDGGRFESLGAQRGLPTAGSEARALAWGDFDQDGDSDLFIGARDRVYLMKNEGGRFSDVAADAGIELRSVASRQASWIDIDNDGDLDLYVANRSGSNFLFRNDGSRFTEVGAALGLADARRTVGVCWFDLDQDGDLDAFMASQAGDTDAVYRNDGGKFVDIAATLRMDRPGRPSTEGSVGCAPGDYDNDGDLDLFVASYGTSVLYRNDGGTFVDVAGPAGVAIAGHAVGASWGDYDSDGDVDLYVTDYVNDTDSQSKAHLFRNDAGRFTEMLTRESRINSADHGVQWADIDADGDLDLSLTQGYPASGGVRVFRNELGKAARHRSMQIVVLDRAGHATCSGAEVRLFDRSGGVLGTRICATGDGYNAQSALPLHFGVTRVAPVSVEVTYLTPKGRVKQRLDAVDPAQWARTALIVRER